MKLELTADFWDIMDQIDGTEANRELVLCWLHMKLGGAQPAQVFWEFLSNEGTRTNRELIKSCFPHQGKEHRDPRGSLRVIMHQVRAKIREHAWPLEITAERGLRETTYKMARVD